MSDDLRRAYLLGDSHSLYGNLPGIEPESPVENATTYAFAAMPRPFENRTDQWQASHAGGRASYATARPMKMDGTLNLQEKTWSGATYVLAPCPKTTEPQDVKSMVLEHAIESIRTGNGKWKNKTDCLVNHFNQVLILTQQATLYIDDFNVFESDLFEYTYLSVQSSTHTRVAIPQPGANQANFRRDARYVSAEMSINPRRKYAVLGQPGNNLLPDVDTKTVLFRLPQGPNASLHDAITTENIKDVRQLITICRYLNGTAQFGMLSQNQFTQEKFNQWLEEIKQQTKYEIVARLMRPAFIGEGIIETPVNRLVQCQQKGTNDKGQTVASTIAEHYAKFTAIVQQLNAEVQFPVNLPTTFFNSLTTHMQSKLNRRQYRHPPPSTNQDQLTQLQRLRDLAAEEEKDIETQIALIKNTLAPVRPAPFNVANRSFQQQKPMARTFMASYGGNQNGGNTGYSGGEGIGNTNEAYGRNNGGNQAYGGMAAMAAYEGMAPDEDFLMEQFQLVNCFLSPAESALRNASGVERPIECWGCTDHGTHHANRFHSFRDCPHKYDPEVRSIAFRRMKQMREEWEGRKQQAGYGTRKREGQALLSKAEATRDWQHLGFNSRQEAENVADAVALMATDVSARNRKNLSREWSRKVVEAIEPTGGNDETEAPSYYGPATRSRDNQPYHFIARIFQAMPLKPLPLEISPTLPHCQFPIGGSHGKGKLKVAVDSCAGVNIGHLEFHKTMAELFPELVASFKTMQEYGEKEVTIGGVEVSATTLKLTHIIEYKTPYRYNGTACNLTCSGNGNRIHQLSQEDQGPLEL